eukprot:2113887-Pyramimonas_sp.AAC.1
MAVGVGGDAAGSYSRGIGGKRVPHARGGLAPPPALGRSSDLGKPLRTTLPVLVASATNKPQPRKWMAPQDRYLQNLISKVDGLLAKHPYKDKHVQPRYERSQATSDGCHPGRGSSKCGSSVKLRAVM